MLYSVLNVFLKRRLIVQMIFFIGVVLRLFPQVRTVTAHIEDAETGEALPFAHVIISKGKSTLSNLEGDFSIAANAGDTLLIRNMGYFTRRIAVSDLQDVVKLHPSSVQLREVTVIPIGSILDKVREQLRYSLKKGSHLNNTYFCRIVEDFGERVEMLEAFVNAKSAVHLRDFNVITGKHSRLDDQQGTLPTLNKMNLHHFLELGPMMAYNDFWNILLDLPFDGKNLEMLYDYDYSVQDEGSGRTVYVVHLKSAARTGVGRLLLGTAYIDTKTYRLLRFQSVVPTVYMKNQLGHRTWKTTVFSTFTIEYSYSRNGVAEVSNISFEAKGSGVRASGLMLLAKGSDLSKAKGRKVEGNVIASIENAGFDSIMWANSNFVQRTNREEEAARRYSVLDGQENVFLHIDNTHYQPGDTIWFSAYTNDVERNCPSRISKVLYVEMLRPDGLLHRSDDTGLPVRKRVEMNNGRGQGFFVLGKSDAEGRYTLRAYTRWQRNWIGENFPFYSKTVYVSQPVAEGVPNGLTRKQAEGCGRIKIDGLKPQYAPYEKIELKVRLAAPEEYSKIHSSIAVCSAEHQLLKEDSDNIFVLNRKSAKAFAPSHPKEQTFVLRGRAIRNKQDTIKFRGEEDKQTKGKKKGKGNEAYIFAILHTNRGDAELPCVRTETDGRFEMRIPLFYGECMLYIDATEAEPRKLASHKWDVATGSTGSTLSQRQGVKIKPSPFRLELDCPCFDEPLQTVDEIYGAHCIPLRGFSLPVEFHSTGHDKQTLPDGTDDYRRTLYWNPDLRFDENGEATVTFYNNARYTTLSIEVEGQADDGSLIWGQWYSHLSTSVTSHSGTGAEALSVLPIGE